MAVITIYTDFESESESEVAQSCPTLRDHMDCSLPVFSVHRIFQERVLEWDAIAFSRESSQHRDRTWVSCIAGRFFIVWSGLPFPSPMHESEKWKWSRSAMSDSLQPHGLQPARLLCPWNSPGQNTGVGSCSLLQGIFPTAALPKINYLKAGSRFTDIENKLMITSKEREEWRAR